MKDVKLFIQGFIVGIGKIIPGVSGAMFAMMFGIYEKALDIISNLRTKLMKNLKYILILAISIGLAIIFGSSIIKKCLENYYLPTMLLFIGMMVGGIKPLMKNVKGKKLDTRSLVSAIIVVTILFLISLIDGVEKTEVLEKTPLTFIILIFAGFLDAFATVVPGICGTALLMILGYYNTVIGALSDLFNFSNLGTNLFILIPFGIGLFSGVFLISKLINYLFKNYKTETYYSIIGFALMSIVLLILEVLEKTYVMNEIIIALVLFVIGYLIVYFIEREKK